MLKFYAIETGIVFKDSCAKSRNAALRVRLVVQIVGDEKADAPLGRGVPVRQELGPVETLHLLQFSEIKIELVSRKTKMKNVHKKQS